MDRRTFRNETYVAFGTLCETLVDMSTSYSFALLACFLVCSTIATLKNVSNHYLTLAGARENARHIESKDCPRAPVQTAAHDWVPDEVTSVCSQTDEIGAAT